MPNRVPAIVGTVVAALVAATVAACAPDPPAPAAGAPPPTGGPAVAVTPYVDVSLPDPPLVAMADATGVDDAVLAFGLATDGTCAPAWGGTVAVDDPGITDQAAALRNRGGRLTVATGGASGDYLENTCDTASDLAGAYTRLLDATGATGLDVDVETDIPDETVVAALQQVQQQRGGHVSLTLQVADQHQGLEDQGLDLARAAAAAGLRFDVDALVMDFPPDGAWAQAMTDAVSATRAQVATISPMPGTAVTIMIGRTDTGPVTTLDDARTVARDVAAQGVRDLRFWSLGRDRGGCPGASEARPDCSGVAQQDFAFIETLRDAVRDAPTTGRNGS
ncbi:MAG: hypothetical protein ABT15_29230 [Pseudonocardia sp. SCN 73-27]|nr:MAG: hypothetical protein ABS80_19805 [Pseudonocardia sp. SCN 72-51]ODV00566.1 MAG: hypothetical protein ABT15_29230 [Pseudonocardia sp. SCN 73-27]